MFDSIQTQTDSTFPFREILDHTPGGVLVERDARIVYINPTYALLLGYEPRELVGRNIAAIVAREDRERLIEFGRSRSDEHAAPATYEFLALRKSGATISLTATVATIRTGAGFFITTFIREQPMQDMSSYAPARLDSLSGREKQVIDRLLSGKRPKEIAFELGLSVKTVSTHQTRALQKLGVADRYELYRISSRLSA